MLAVLLPPILRWGTGATPILIVLLFKIGTETGSDKSYKAHRAPEEEGRNEGEQVKMSHTSAGSDPAFILHFDILFILDFLH